MKNGSVMKLLNASKQFTKKHAPEIMTAVGIGSMVVSVASAITSTPKAIANVEQAEREKGEQLTKTEVVKAAWKCYIPTAVSFAVGTGCLIGANSVSTRRTAAMAAAYKISETALTDLKEAVKETVDEEKAQEIKEKVNKKQVERAISENREVIHLDDGELCYDQMSGRLFRSDWIRVGKAANKVMWLINHQMHASLNDFYYELGLPPIAIGDQIGWNHDNPIDIPEEPDSGITEDHKSYIVVDFLIRPIHDFDKLY